MDNLDIDNFELHLEFVVNVLKTQDEVIIETFKRSINTLLDSDYIREVIISAMVCLAEVDSETFFWALYHYDPELHLEMRRRTVVWAAQQLVDQGFAPGKDFSSIPGGGLMANRSARKALLKLSVAASALLLEDILYPVSDFSIL